MAKHPKKVRKGLFDIDDMELTTSSDSGLPGELPHKHKYKKGDRWTSTENKHRHRIALKAEETEVAENHVHSIFSNSFDF